MKLIEKDAVVTEIERHLEHVNKGIEYAQMGVDRDLEHYKKELAIWQHCQNMCKQILSFINSQEVKEVDLNEEIEKCLKRYNMLAVGKKDFTDIAKHFFELGLHSTITEGDCKLIWNIGDEIPAMSEEEFFKELLRRYKAQKGE